MYYALWASKTAPSQWAEIQQLCNRAQVSLFLWHPKKGCTILLHYKASQALTFYPIMTFCKRFSLFLYNLLKWREEYSNFRKVRCETMQYYDHVYTSLGAKLHFSKYREIYTHTLLKIWSNGILELFPSQYMTISILPIQSLMTSVERVQSSQHKLNSLIKYLSPWALFNELRF